MASTQPNIDFITGKKTNEVFGISRYNYEIFKRITDYTLNKIEFPVFWPGNQWTLEEIVKETFYPLIVASKMKKGNIKYVGSQDMAFLAKILTMKPLLMTCFDLIPWTYYGNRSIFWKLNLKGLKNADHLIAISEFTRTEIMNVINRDIESISVIYCGVDRAIFHPQPSGNFFTETGLNGFNPVLMYTGSEEPRKNFSYILKVIYRLKIQYPNILLIKVGKPQKQRAIFKKQIKNMDLEQNIYFVDYVSDATLVKYYNSVDLFIFPSYYEGFGLPPLEAMACGCPVIVSDRTSLPEVVGDAGIYIDPDNVESCVDAIHTLLNDKNYRNELGKKGIEQSKKFDWDVAAKQMSRIILEYQTES